MRRAPMSLSFPPFTRAIKVLIAINTAVFLLQLILRATGYGPASDQITEAFGLSAYYVVHGRIYQLLTYAFLHASFFHLFFNILMLCMFAPILATHQHLRLSCTSHL